MTKGVYAYIRHPLYSSFLIFLFLGIAIYFKSYLIIFAQIISIMIAGIIVKKEESFLKDLFGKEYVKYSKRTKKFIPFVL